MMIDHHWDLCSLSKNILITLDFSGLLRSFDKKIDYYKPPIIPTVIF